MGHLVIELYLHNYSLILYWKLCNVSFISWICKWAREGVFQGIVTRIQLQYGNSIDYCEIRLKHSFGNKKQKYVGNLDYLIRYPQYARHFNFASYLKQETKILHTKILILCDYQLCSSFSSTFSFYIQFIIHWNDTRSFKR